MKNNELVLTDGKSFDVFISFVNIENPLGQVRATLKEYTLVQSTEDYERIVYKLHKTKDGFWYDHPYMEKPAAFLMMNLKKAIDDVETDQY